MLKKIPKTTAVASTAASVYSIGLSLAAKMITSIGADVWLMSEPEIILCQQLSEI
jgi:hypothetical protein